MLEMKVVVESAQSRMNHSFRHRCQCRLQIGFQLSRPRCQGAAVDSTLRNKTGSHSLIIHMISVGTSIEYVNAYFFLVQQSVSHSDSR